MRWVMALLFIGGPFGLRVASSAPQIPGDEIRPQSWSWDHCRMRMSLKPKRMIRVSHNGKVSSAFDLVPDENPRGRSVREALAKLRARRGSPEARQRLVLELSRIFAPLLELSDGTLRVPSLAPTGIGSFPRRPASPTAPESPPS